MGAAAAVVLGLGLTACGGDPPQIVDYAPQRNTIDVSTAAPIRITFDHDVDQASVAGRLHLAPSTIGSVRWISGRQLVYDHVTLLTNTNYEVILEPGYHRSGGQHVHASPPLVIRHRGSTLPGGFHAGQPRHGGGSVRVPEA